MKAQKIKTHISKASFTHRVFSILLLGIFLFGCATSKTSPDSPYFLSSDHAREKDFENDPNFSDGTIYPEEFLSQQDEEVQENEPDTTSEEGTQESSSEQKTTETPLDEQPAPPKQPTQAELQAQKDAAKKVEEERLANQRRLAQEKAQAEAAAKDQATTEDVTTIEPTGDDVINPAEITEEEAPVPDFVMTVFKDEDIQVVLEGEGWIMANPGPELNFLRKEYTLTGQSVFFLKANEIGEFMLAFSRSASMGIEKKHVLLQVKEKTPESIQEGLSKSEESAKSQPESTQGTPKPDVPATTQTSPGSESESTIPGPGVPAIPMQPILPPTTSTTEQETLPGGSTQTPPASQAQPPAVVRDLELAPPTMPTETVPPVPEVPTPVGPINRDQLRNLEQIEVKKMFDALSADPARMNDAIIVGEEFIDRFPKDNLSAEILYTLGQLFEKQGPSVDRRRAYDYYTRAYENYPISPYSRMSKQRMSYLEQFYFRLP